MSVEASGGGVAQSCRGGDGDRLALAEVGRVGEGEGGGSLGGRCRASGGSKGVEPAAQGALEASYRAAADVVPGGERAEGDVGGGTQGQGCERSRGGSREGQGDLEPVGCVQSLPPAAVPASQDGTDGAQGVGGEGEVELHDLVVKVEIVSARVVTDMEGGAGGGSEVGGAVGVLRGRGERYAVYTMEVVSRNGRRNRVSRRYHDFSKLHWMLLSASGPDMGAAKEAALRLPPKHIFSMSSLSDAFLQERQGELQRYIDRLLAAPALARCASVFSFFFGASEDAEGKGGRSASAGGVGRDGDAFALLVAADAERSRKRGLKVPWDLRKEDKKDRGRSAEGGLGGDLDGRSSPDANKAGTSSLFAVPPSPPAALSSGSSVRRRVGGSRGRGSSSPVTAGGGDVAGGLRGGGMLLSGGGAAGRTAGSGEGRSLSRGGGGREGE